MINLRYFHLDFNYLFLLIFIRPQPPRPALFDRDDASILDWKTVIESKNHSIEWKDSLIEVDSMRMES
jgi:hypothetical protein